MKTRKNETLHKKKETDEQKDGQKNAQSRNR
jgi:hypothetical protein